MNHETVAVQLHSVLKIARLRYTVWFTFFTGYTGGGVIVYARNALLGKGHDSWSFHVDYFILAFSKFKMSLKSHQCKLYGGICW